MSQIRQTSNNPFFNDKGWCIPTGSDIIFGSNHRNYYKTNQETIKFNDCISRHSEFTSKYKISKPLNSINDLINTFKTNNNYSNLLYGPCIPFVLEKKTIKDIGDELESSLLNTVSSSFKDFYPSSNFKAVIQDKTSLSGKLAPSEKTGYGKLLDMLSEHWVCGLYFPMALQEYSVHSQQQKLLTLPHHDGICISGPLEVSSALIGCPNLLINKKNYSPLLCLSGVSHVDPRLICCYKSYGPHLEFWCFSQMLTKSKFQVSEQWSGGISIYQSFIP